MTPDAGAQPGEPSPADGSGPRELLAYRSAQGRWVVTAMILGSSVAGIDSTVVAVALPAIGRNLHASFQALQWTVTSYTLTLAALILLAGSLSDRWGRRRVFLAGLGWFTLASVLCAAAPGIGWLIAARAVQGIGGALMTPASLAIIEATFRPGDRTRAIGTWAGFSGVSAAIAPFLGGWLLEAGSWRAIFLINVPVAAVTAWTTRRHVPESRDTSRLRARRLARRAGRRRRAGRDHLRDPRPARRGRRLAAVRRGRGARRGVLGRLRRRRTARQPSHAAAGDLRPGAVPRRQRRHLRRQRRPRRLRVRLHPRPGDHRRLQPGGGGLGPGAGHRRDLAAVGNQRPAGSADRPPAATGGGLPAVRGRVHCSPCASAPRGYWTAVLPVAVLFGLGLASLLPPLTATAMNSAPDSLAGLASGVNNAVARVAGLLWIAALPPITGLTGAAYADPARFRSSFGQISWICAAAFACAAALAAAFITGPGRPAPAARAALIQTPVPHSPARSPSATNRDKPADRTAARQPTGPARWVRPRVTPASTLTHRRAAYGDGTGTDHRDSDQRRYGDQAVEQPVRSAPRRSTAENQATNTTAVTTTARYSRAASSVPVSGRRTGGPPARRTSTAAASNWAAASPPRKS